jgi:fimbrial chaperone protein
LRRDRHVARGLATACFLLVAALINCAEAASIAVDPITFTMQAAQGAEVLRVSNTDDKPVRVQVTPMAWALVDGSQHESESDGLLLNPPIFSIDAHKMQFVRFGLRQHKVPEIEESYRLLVEEVPDPNAAQVSGLRTVLRLSVPVFVAPERPVKHLTWQLLASADGMHLVAVNDGNVHQRLVRVSALGDGKAATVISSVATYVLPGERHDWLVPGIPSSTQNLTLAVINEQGAEEQVLVSSSPSH